MNKICTSIEQSKKLIELGIDINTADLTVIDLPIQGGDRFKFVSSKLPNDTFPSITDGKSERIPAWSLSALIKILPKGFLLMDDQGESESGLYSVWVPGFNSPHIWKDNSLDAAFQMIVWLKENKKI